MVLDDAPGVFLRRFAGVFIGDRVKCFLVNQMLGRGEQEDTWRQALPITRLDMTKSYEDEAGHA